MVRLHPLPGGCSPGLADIIGKAVAGAVMSAFDAHLDLPRAKRGALVGSIRKRAVNQLCCDEGREKLRQALNG